ncbi:MAG: hypothetical protein ABSG85_12375 [Spirochaetia bacterium]
MTFASVYSLAFPSTERVETMKRRGLPTRSSITASRSKGGGFSMIPV